MKEFLEGSRAVAEIIKLCKPGVISAYPITPQTHIVEELAQMVADGEVDAQFVNVESEHSAASVVLGAVATGVRAFTATSSQGLLYMAEVLFNISGLRLPLVMTCANRAISAPINIWCFTEEAEVLMSDLTYKKINKINEGDEVLGKNKKGYLVSTKVLKTYKRECDNIVKLITDKFALICTPEHKFYHHPTHTHWVQAKSLKNKYLHWFGYGFETSKEFMRGWLAGVIDGDGSFFIDKKRRHNFRINVKDEEIITTLINYASHFGFAVRRKDYRRKEGLYGAIISKTPETNRFLEFLKKSKNIDFCRGYLAGIYDAEGSGPYKVKQAVIYNKDKELVNVICNYLKFLGFNFKSYIDKDDVVQIKINNVPEFFVKCRPLLARKRNNIFNTTLKSVKNRLKILDVMVVKTKTEVYNIETTTHNYIVNGLLVHNCDQQDSVSLRDSGWIQLYAENIQEAADLHLVGYRLSEDKSIMLPVMVCMDGFILTHGMETVDIPRQEEVDKFLPGYQPLYKLDPAQPLTMGLLADPDYYLETRFAIQETFKDVLKMIPKINEEFKNDFGRDYKDGLVQEYFTRDAEKVIVAMGSVCGTIKEVVDAQRAKGKKVGLLKIISYRPFPYARVYDVLKDVPRVAVLDKAVSPGAYAPLAIEVKAAFCGKKKFPKVISSFVAGLGGRDITLESVKEIFGKLTQKEVSLEFIDLKPELLKEEYGE